MIVLQKIPSILLYLVIFSLPFHFLGSKNNNYNRSKFIYNIFSATALLGVSIYLFQLPITYKTQAIAADRTLFPLCCLIYLYSCYIFYQIGTQNLIRNKITSQVLITTIFTAVLIINCINLWKQYPIVKKYASAYDQRLHLIETSYNDELIKLPPLPNSGFIYSNEISNNPAHFTNQHLKKGFQ